MFDEIVAALENVEVDTETKIEKAAIDGTLNLKVPSNEMDIIIDGNLYFGVDLYGNNGIAYLDAKTNGIPVIDLGTMINGQEVFVNSNSLQVLIVWLNISSVSPGKPTKTSVVIDISGLIDLIFFILL